MGQAPTYQELDRQRGLVQEEATKAAQRQSAVEDANAMSTPNPVLQDYMNTSKQQGLTAVMNEPVGYGMTRGDLEKLGVPLEFQDQVTDRELQGLVADYSAKQANNTANARAFIGLDSGPVATPTEVDAWRQYSQ